jgi:hypothetical protein
MAAGATIKHFTVCNGVAVELLNPWYSDLKLDIERLIGRPHLDGEKLVRNCQLFALPWQRCSWNTGGCSRGRYTVVYGEQFV